MRQTSGAAVGELILPAAVVAVVGMMVFPLPTAVLDVLLVINIGFALSLVIAAVYLNEPERFTSLPAILLLSTLFRLGLNISTTRQILSFGEAPELVSAFGGFVVGGNFVVGSVIFLIVTIVQFLVIAKGAERVAEVAARFTLDAMPGKQMSIDADVRAGVISLAEARERRRDLHRESKLYGSLDGAMKFIKGDAIAGVLITMINITAGLLLGITQHGLSFSEALQRYTIFTVGDGLVAQIPALLVSVAAGIAVTRVGDKEDSLIGRDIFEQLGREPRALSITGVVLAMAAFVPGMPSAAFLCLAAVMLAAGVHGSRCRSAAVDDAAAGFRPVLNPAFVLRLSAPALRAVKEEGVLTSRLEKLKASMFEKWGILLPEIRYELLEGTVPQYQLFFRGGKVCSGGPADQRLSDTLCSALEAFLENHLRELIDDSQTRMLLDAHQPRCEDLINGLFPAMLSTTALTAVLRELVSEKVSVRELGVVLQALADYLLEQPARGAVKKPLEWDGQLRGELVAAARRALGRSIAAPLIDQDGRMECWALEPELEDLLYGVRDSRLLDPKLRAALCTSVAQAAQQHVQRPMIIVSTEAIRAAVKTAVKPLPDIVVVAFEELPEEVSLVVKGCISVNSAGCGGDLSIFEKRVIPLRA